MIKLMTRANGNKLQANGLNPITNKMTLDINMIGTLMKHRILSNVNDKIARHGEWKWSESHAEVVKAV